MTIIKLSELEKDVLIVSLVSGNYISTRDGILVRGDYHGKLKYELMSNSHHIYILSPLGKIFNKSAERINKIIESSDVPFASQKEYKKLDHKDVREYEKWKREQLGQKGSDPEPDFKAGIKKLIPEALLDEKLKENEQNKNSFKQRKVFLITTYRGANYRGENNGLLYPDVLSNYFSSISTSIEENFKQGNDESGKDNNILFRDEFNPQNDSYQVVRQLNILKDPAEVLFNYEFPHREIRTEMKRYLNSTDIYTFEE